MIYLLPYRYFIARERTLSRSDGRYASMQHCNPGTYRALYEAMT